MSAHRLAGLLAVALCATARAATLPPVELTVVDEQLDTPVAGVFVLLQATASRAGNGHDGVSEHLFTIEGLSNPAGEIELPAENFNVAAFGPGGSFDGPTVVLLRRGYAVRVLHNAPLARASLADFTSWPFQGQTVKLRRVVRLADQADAAQAAAEQAARAIANAGVCGWQRFPRFLVQADRMAVEWNLRAPTAVDEKLQHRIAARPLQQLLARDRSYVVSGCPSPRTFFEPYMQ